MANRRAYVNFVWYRVLSPRGDEGIARSCDLSETGIGVVTPRDLEVGSLLMLEVMTTAGNVSAVARVRHTNPSDGGCFRLGLELAAMPPNDRRLWAELATNARSSTP